MYHKIMKFLAFSRMFRFSQFVLDFYLFGSPSYDKDFACLYLPYHLFFKIIQFIFQTDISLINFYFDINYF